MKALMILLLGLPMAALAAEHGGRAAEHGGSPAAEHGGKAAKKSEHGGKAASEKKDHHEDHEHDEGHEHDEQGGDPAEHGGKPAKGDEHAGTGLLQLASNDTDLSGIAAETMTEAPDQYYVKDIKAATQAWISSRTDDDGVFRIRDEQTGKVVELVFDKIHDPVRQIDDTTYFACTDFHVVGNEKKLYDLDFWMNPQSGELQVVDEKIHKEPRRSLLYGWYKQPRYTFVDDKVVSLY